ncbi:hypothetical protein JCM11491_003860 [Sporobolomyces phaffii]
MPPLGPASTIAVVVVSPLNASDARLVVNHLTGRSTEARAASEPTEPSAASPHSVVVPWAIRNKYYSADVQFRIVELELEQGAGRLAAPPVGLEPAVVVLVPSQANPSKPLTTLLGSLAARDPEIDVALLVTVPRDVLSALTEPPSGTQPSGKVKGEVKLDAWDDVAIDHGFEWVDLGANCGGTDGEQHEGITRVRDALESHVWDEMERVPPNTSDRARAPRLESDDGHAVDVTRVDGDDDDEDDLASLGAPPLPEPRPFVPTKLEFPATFLPAVPRARPAAKTIGDGARASFDDDFSPFVDASSSASNDLADPSESGSANRDDWTDFAGARPRSSEHEDEDEEAEEFEHLDDLFEQIRLARDDLSRQETGGRAGGSNEGEDEEAMLRRRRERAEQMMAQVFGSRGGIF